MLARPPAACSTAPLSSIRGAVGRALESSRSDALREMLIVQKRERPTIDDVGVVLVCRPRHTLPSDQVKSAMTVLAKWGRSRSGMS